MSSAMIDAHLLIRFIYSKFIILIFCFFPEILFADTLKVGVIAPLTGALAEYGVATKNGLELAKKNNPDIFKNIDFVYEDSQYDPKLALGIYRKFREDKNIKIIFNWGSNPSAPLIPVAEVECFPLVTMDFSLTKPIARRCAMGFVNSTLELGSSLATQLKSTAVKNIAIVKVENAYINGMLEGLKHGLGSQTNLDVVATFEPSDTNFKSLITRLKAKQYDALGIFLYTGQVATFYQQMKAQGFKISTFGTDFFESRSEIKNAGEYMQSAVYAHLNVKEDFARNYVEQYASDSQITSAGSSYDFAMLVAKLFGDGKELVSQQIIDRFRNSGPQQGVLGNYAFKDLLADGPRFRFPIYIKLIHGDGFKIVS